MKTLVSKLLGLFGPKVLWVFVLTLGALLAVSHVSNNSKDSDIRQLQGLADQTVEQNKRLSNQNKELVQQLETRPTLEVITVKEVMTEICNGKVGEAMVDALPSKRPKEVVNETPVADIDDRLPDDLVRLLK